MSIINEQRRIKLDRARSKYLATAEDLVRAVLSEEQDAMDNVPENLRESERHRVMEDGVDAMEDALDNICEASRLLRSVLEPS